MEFEQLSTETCKFWLFLFQLSFNPLTFGILPLSLFLYSFGYSFYFHLSFIYQFIFCLKALSLSFALLLCMWKSKLSATVKRIHLTFMSPWHYGYEMEPTFLCNFQGLGYCYEGWQKRYFYQSWAKFLISINLDFGIWNQANVIDHTQISQSGVFLLNKQWPWTFQS